MGRIKESKRRGNNAGNVYLERGRYVLMYSDPISGKRQKKTLITQDANNIGLAITEKSTAGNVAAEFLAGIQKIAVIETKAELMVKVAKAEKIIHRIRLNLSEIWTSFECSPEHPDSGPGTLKKYKIFFDRFTAWLKKSRHVADAGQIDADTAAAFKKQVRVFVSLCCRTGCRKQDAALMCWQTVNFTSNAISYPPLRTSRWRSFRKSPATATRL